MSFEKFYSVYPRRINKAQAQKSYIKAIKSGATDEQLINGAIEYQQWCDRNGTARENICHPATWLNQGRRGNDYRADDSSKSATGNSNQPRQSGIRNAMASAIKVIQKDRSETRLEVRYDGHGNILPF
ncbi:hypothetical protein L0663_05110 [Dyadobacter sp. CY107]|uniref:hypothetical protein n=1 Tax=Dyadobacter fanqingshengii TaxID=2906443 RepID=UPI001F1989A7|nr:hypothetical protein [Dyadobacter fanqingshengii]MCF2502746.1 hypothetical protein [Dyadobacter fanqingshengii]